LLASRSEFRYFTFDGLNDPIVSVMSIESLGVEGSPLIKWYPVFTFISSRKISLFFPLFGPFGTSRRPWSVIFGNTPWVSHFDELMDALSILGKAKTIKDSIGVTSNHVVVTNLTSSGHWVLCFYTIENNIPKFVIGHFTGVMLRDWHTSESSESFTWSSTVDIGVVNIEFSESLLKHD